MICLTQQQLEEAQAKVAVINTNASEIEIAIKPLGPISGKDFSMDLLFDFITLHFKRKVPETERSQHGLCQWVLATPVLVVDEWVARQMQTILPPR